MTRTCAHDRTDFTVGGRSLFRLLDTANVLKECFHGLFDDNEDLGRCIAHVDVVVRFA